MKYEAVLKVLEEYSEFWKNCMGMQTENGSVRCTDDKNDGGGGGRQ